ncbi:MAG TPA: hypothetical protein VF035_05930 [Longimicrobiales bacterium]
MKPAGRTAKRAAARADSRKPRAAARTSATQPAPALLVQRHPFLTAAVPLALYLLLSFLTFLPQPHTGGDSAQYLTLARSLVAGTGYTDLYDPLQLPHTKYPPVFPLLLAAGIVAGLKTWVQLKLVMVLIGGAAITFTYLFIRRRGRPVLATGVALILALSPGVLEQTHWLLSDVPFWMFTMLALWAFDRLRPHQWGRFAVAVIAMTLAYFTRSAGLPLLLACAGWLAWRRRWVQLAATLTVVTPPALLWWLRARNTGGVAYAQEFWFVNPYQPDLGMIGVPELFGRIGENAFKYATIHLPVLLTGGLGTVATALALLVTAFALFGWATRLRRTMVAELLMPLYIGLLFVWPAVWSGERFLLPIFPLLLYYAATGAARLLQRVAPPVMLAVAGATVALLLMIMTPALSAGVAAGRACTSQFRQGETYPCLFGPERSYFDVAAWAAAALPDDAVVLSRKPRLFYAISDGIRGTNYPMSADPDALFSLADSVGARYVVYDRLTSLADAYLAPVLLSRPAAFCVLRSFGTDGTVVFGIRPGARSLAPPPPGTPQDGRFEACDDSYLKRPAQRPPAAP